MTRTSTTPYGTLVTTRARVVTWNLWWRLGDWEARAEAITHTLEDLRPDLVCLQEVWQEGDRNQAALLGARLGLHHTFASDRTEGGVDQGVALLSRWPLTEIERRPLPVPPGVERPNVALRAVVQGPRGPLLPATTHLIPYPHRSACRELQVRALVEFLAECRRQPPISIVCGDFNTAPLLLPDLRWDYIFVSWPSGPGGVVPSDHYAVLAELRY